MKVAVIGTGPFAQGVAKLASRSGATHKYNFVIGSRRIAQGAEPVYLPGLDDVPMHSIEDAVKSAEIVILAIQSSGLSSFAEQYGQLLVSKIIVDVTNPWENDLNKLQDSSSPRSSQSGHISIELGSDYSEKMENIKSLANPMKDYDTKPGSVAEYLEQSLGLFNCPVVKALNNLSAYSLVHGCTLTEHMKTVVAANNEAAGVKVKELLEAMGVQVQLVKSLKYARVMEKWQHGCFNTWHWPAAVMFLMWVPIFIYSFVRYNHFGTVKWENVVMFILNKSIAWLSLWGLIITYLPGICIICTLLITRKPQIRLWGWIKAWMDGRKQLGNMTFLAMFMHLALSIFLWIPSYFAKLFEPDVQVVPKLAGSKLDKYGMMSNAPEVKASVTMLANGTGLATVAGGVPGIVLETANVINMHSKLNVYGELVILTGVVAGVMMFFCAFTSVPGITPKMNWREWKLMQSWAGWLSLALSLAHTMLLAPVPAWNYDKDTWPAGIPTITLISVAPGLLVIAIKILLEAPPVPWYLSQIRAGKYKQGNVRAVYC